MIPHYNYKTIQYQSDVDDSIPFPSIDLKICDPTNKKFVSKKGKIDTGSSITVIPESILDKIHVVQLGSRDVCGINGDSQKYNTYIVNIQIQDKMYEKIRVITQPDKVRKNVLIGRNLINLWYMIFKSQTRTGTIKSWSTNSGDCYLNTS